MVSLTRITKRRRALRKRNQGRRRKNKMAKRSTVSTEELFAALGEPGKPAPGLASKE